MKHPIPNATTAAGPYWTLPNGTDESLLLPWCEHCGRSTWPPRWRCTCGGTLSWKPAPGAGELVTWSVVHRAVQPEMQDEVPYVVGFVRLDAGVVVFSNLVNVRVEALHRGMRLRSRRDVLESRNGPMGVPVFEPDPEPSCRGPGSGAGASVE